MSSRRARELWLLLEPIHGLMYFAPDARDRFEAVGLKGYWMGYFASRSAALGPVGPEVVTAAFYVFHPTLVARALPDAWSRSTPETVLTARQGLALSCLRQALGDLADGDEVRTAAELAVTVAQAADHAGRPLSAAHAALPVPPADEPLARLWWAATVLREHRGDGHMSTLMQGDVDPCASLVLDAAAKDLGPDGTAALQAARKWSDEEWQAVTDRLVARGWLDEAGTVTEMGKRISAGLEATTDRLAAAPYRVVGDAHLDALAQALRPLTRQIVRSGTYPIPNPVGIDPRSDGGD